MAGGARGWATGAWDLTPEHPPLMSYLYGLPVFLSGAVLPRFQAAPSREEVHHGSPRERDFTFRYAYAREVFWGPQARPVQLALAGRAVAMAMAVLLVLLVHAMVARGWGWQPGLTAAALVAFLPDVLAHGAVAYNDVPFAAAFLAAVWAADEAARRPTPSRGALLGLIVGLAFAIKYTALVLLPVVALVMLLEAGARTGRRVWVKAAAVALLAASLTAWAVLTVVHRGDPTLREFRWAVGYSLEFAARGHGWPVWFNGEFLERAPLWAPLFLLALKTPIALQALLLTSIGVGLWRIRGAAPADVLASKLRAPVLGCAAVFASVALSRTLAFRYVLPGLVLLPIIASGLLAPALKRGAVLAAIFVLAGWQSLSALSRYPDFLAYASGWGGKDPAVRVGAENFDWGQGLLGLEAWMQKEGVPSVYLSYAGSAMPNGYGIRYVALPSIFPLSPFPDAGEGEPRFAVVSAFMLTTFLPGDPLGGFRGLAPDRTIGGALRVYRTERAEVRAALARALAPTEAGAP
jgi:hypothetical protein